ncbi:MAG: hypothetical protein LBC31_03575 [Treponema sp.]|nr:hypothetical protein [Treponema sp.]
MFAGLFIPAFPGAAQSRGGEEFFAGPAAETAVYSAKGGAFGGGLTLGYGYGPGAMGFRLIYFGDGAGLSTLETGIFLRLYLPREGEGLFVQANAGACIFALNGNFDHPGAGGMSAGLSAGWRFLLRDRWYVEPYLRAGYPYIVGAGVSAGFRF